MIGHSRIAQIIEAGIRLGVEFRSRVYGIVIVIDIALAVSAYRLVIPFIMRAGAVFNISEERFIGI